MIIKYLSTNYRLSRQFFQFKIALDSSCKRQAESRTLLLKGVSRSYSQTNSHARLYHYHSSCVLLRAFVCELISWGDALTKIISLFCHILGLWDPLDCTFVQRPRTLLSISLSLWCLVIWNKSGGGLKQKPETYLYKPIKRLYLCARLTQIHIITNPRRFVHNRHRHLPPCSASDWFRFVLFAPQKVWQTHTRKTVRLQEQKLSAGTLTINPHSD